MTNMVDHAKRELEFIGEDEAVVDGYLKMIEIFSDMNHSGGSASVFIPTLNELLQFHNLSPLTDDPDEWMYVGEEQWGEPGGVWQSTRRHDAFSHDGGKTYYLLSEGGNARNREPLHKSYPEACRRWHKFEECKLGENHPVIKDE